MARKPRLEVEGELYHLITLGVERRDIFHSADDYRKFLTLLAVQKAYAMIMRIIKKVGLTP
jgi:hypothetical protein